MQIRSRQNGHRLETVVRLIRNEWQKASLELITSVQRVRKKIVSNAKLVAFTSGRTQPIDATICTVIVLLVSATCCSKLQLRHSPRPGRHYLLC